MSLVWAGFKPRSRQITYKPTSECALNIVHFMSAPAILILCLCEYMKPPASSTLSTLNFSNLHYNFTYL